MILQTPLLNNSIKQNMPPRHYHIMNVVESWIIHLLCNQPTNIVHGIKNHLELLYNEHFEEKKLTITMKNPWKYKK